MILYWTHVVLVFGLFALSDAFLSPHQQSVRPPPHQQRQSTILWLYSDEEMESIDAMRKLLESSWNSVTMGQVPTNAEAAAEAAATSLTSAMDAASSGKSRIHCIDILLPQYDIQQGSKIYDEVLATEFCIHLAKRLQGRTEILVRDDPTLATISRVLKAREKEPEITANDGRHDGTAVGDDEGEIIGAEAKYEAALDDSSSAPDSDIESFRRQLMQGWNEADDKSESQIEEADVPTFIEIEPTSDSSTLTPTPMFRLASMLGSATNAASADGNRNDFEAAAQNAKPLENEDTIMILSATSPMEMIAVRSLVARYGDTKTFVLVNCHLNPTPRELFSAQIVYSVLPLIARPRQNGQDAGFQPKIVVMRRYPADWEIFVDADGNGFELAGSFAPGRVDRRGPSMQVVSDCVKAHLHTRKGR
jgi:hypothetical protein